MVNYSRYFNGRLEDLAESIARASTTSARRNGFNNYPWGWAQVGNTPGKRYKQNTHGGGIRDPLIIHWPKGLAEKGGVRHQFHHVTDIAPTIFEIVGANRPQTVNGVPQMPMHGTSLAYTFPPRRSKRRPPSRCSISRCSGTGASGPTAGRPSPITSRKRRSIRQVGTLSPRQGFLGMPRPGQRAAREAEADDRAVVE